MGGRSKPSMARRCTTCFWMTSRQSVCREGTARETVLQKQKELGWLGELCWESGVQGSLLAPGFWAAFGEFYAAGSTRPPAGLCWGRASPCGVLMLCPGWSSFNRLSVVALQSCAYTVCYCGVLHLFSLGAAIWFLQGPTCPHSVFLSSSSPRWPVCTSHCTISLCREDSHDAPGTRLPSAP